VTHGRRSTSSLAIEPSVATDDQSWPNSARGEAAGLSCPFERRWVRSVESVPRKFNQPSC
jgi:hypothetical protein